MIVLLAPHQFLISHVLFIETRIEHFVISNFAQYILLWTSTYLSFTHFQIKYIEYTIFLVTVIREKKI